MVCWALPTERWWAVVLRAALPKVGPGHTPSSVRVVIRVLSSGQIARVEASAAARIEAHTGVPDVFGRGTGKGL